MKIMLSPDLQTTSHILNSDSFSKKILKAVFCHKIHFGWSINSDSFSSSFNLNTTININIKIIPFTLMSTVSLAVKVHLGGRVPPQYWENTNRYSRKYAPQCKPWFHPCSQWPCKHLMWLFVCPHIDLQNAFRVHPALHRSASSAGRQWEGRFKTVGFYLPPLPSLRVCVGVLIIESMFQPRARALAATCSPACRNSPAETPPKAAGRDKRTAPPPPRGTPTGRCGRGCSTLHSGLLTYEPTLGCKENNPTGFHVTCFLRAFVVTGKSWLEETWQPRSRAACCGKLLTRSSPVDQPVSSSQPFHLCLLQSTQSHCATVFGERARC